MMVVVREEHVKEITVRVVVDTISHQVVVVLVGIVALVVKVRGQMLATARLLVLPLVLAVVVEVVVVDR